MTVGDAADAMPPPAGAPVLLPAPWQDLADNVPGQAVADQARIEQEALQRRYTRVGAVLLKVADAKTEERAWRVGARGEKRVGGELDRLAKHGFRVLHAVPVGERGSDIDHVVIGPPGVFTVNTKKHPGARVWVGGACVKVNGRNQPYVRNSRYEAARASKLLSAALGWAAPVDALLVFDTAGSGELMVKTQPDAVTVLCHKTVASWLRKQPHRLSPEQVREVFRYARRATTWVQS